MDRESVCARVPISHRISAIVCVPRWLFSGSIGCVTRLVRRDLPGVSVRYEPLAHEKAIRGTTAPAITGILDLSPVPTR